MKPLVPTLLETARSLRAASDLADALGHVTGAACEIVRASQATLRILDGKGERLLVCARTGPSLHVNEASPFKRGEGVVGWVVENAAPALVEDASRDPRFVIRPGQVEMPRSIIAAPLLGTKGCLGVLGLARMDPPPFSEADLDTLCLLAEIAAPHLDVARLAALSQTDDLTLLYNRRYLDNVLPREMDRARRYGHPLSILMIDLDGFKATNDRFGHDVGDEVLRSFGDRLRALSRFADVSSRWGGEEFLVLMPETAGDRAREVAERLRVGIGGQPHRTSAGPVAVTLSIGVASLEPGDDMTSLVRRADEALYRAKRGGRDRVES